MPWRNDPEARRRSDQTYGDSEYRHNRPVAMRRDRWRCQLQLPADCRCKDPLCRRFHGCIGAASQCDHINPGGGHALRNLRAVCKPCHAKRTAEQGNDAKRTSASADPQPVQRTAW